MPRQARQKSQSGIFHVIFRGINRQSIFADDEDRQKFIEIVKHYKGLLKFEAYGYCLMDNHIHLLLKETDESISNIIKRISSSYVSWYNRKHERCGHLFQERFKSEAIEDDIKFLTVLRFIHQNPIKASLVKSISAYSWSSYNDYMSKTLFIDTYRALSLFSLDWKKAVVLFEKFNNQQSNDKCLDCEEKPNISDREINAFIIKLGFNDISELQQMTRSKRNETIKLLKRINGVTIRRLARITGISKSIIERA